MKTALPVLFAALLMAAPAHANLLSNASFETPIDYAGVIEGNWSAFFGGGSQGTFSTSDPGYSGTIMPSDGDHHLSIINATARDGFSGVQQSFGLVGGEEYTFSFEAKQNGDTFNVGAEYRLEWFNAVGGRVGGQFDLNTAISGLTEDYQTFSLTATAPAEATSAIAVIALQTFFDPPGGDPANFFGDLFVDNSSVDGPNPIPEPSAALLAALALAPLARRRR